MIYNHVVITRTLAYYCLTLIKTASFLDVPSFFLLCRGKVVSLHSEMQQEQIIQQIKELGQKVLPEGASLWLYGSRARGDARPDSDYDLLILINSDTVTADVDSAAYDLCLMGYDNGVIISPHIYPRNQWRKYSFSPFFKNVEQDKRILI